MNSSQKLIIGAIGAAVVIGGAAIGFILAKAPAPADLSTIHSQAASEAPKETMAPETSAPAEPETAAPKKQTASGISADIATYTEGKLSIQYPVVSQMDDAALQEKVNVHLKDNAVSIVKAMELDGSKDTLTVECQVITASRSELAAIYTGLLTKERVAYPTHLFYSNTISLTDLSADTAVSDLGLSDYADAYTMAGYVLSDDVTFRGVSPEQEKALLDYRADLSVEELTAILEDADFPLSDEGGWRQSFSYQKQDAIIFSLPVPHVLGDYVLVSFSPDTK